jgi:CO/xanthine dehydrogenase FAD-binding subunit
VRCISFVLQETVHWVASYLKAREEHRDALQFARERANGSMDLNRVREFYQPTSLAAVPKWQEGFAWLAGGTWLFSEPQPSVRALIDLDTLSWPALQVLPGGLEIASTCKIADLEAFSGPPEWRAASLIPYCCRALQASFKIWNTASVGGNICLSLPAGAMISLTAALEGLATIWTLDGASSEVPIADFVTGNHTNVLAPSDLLRSVLLPVGAMRKRFAFRRFSLTRMGRSSVFLIGTLCPVAGTLTITVTASTVRPIALVFDYCPGSAELAAAIDVSVTSDLYFDDAHGTCEHRRHLTYYYAEQIRAELEAGETRRI